MILASHQPDFYPYMGFFYKMVKADVFLLSYDVAYAPRNMNNYNYIKNPQGKHRITRPITAHEGDNLGTVRLRNDEDMIRRLQDNVWQNYRHCRYFDDVWDTFYFTLHEPYRFLVEYTTKIIRDIAKRLLLKTTIDVAPYTRLKRDERIFRLCELYGADTYLSGHGAAAYHDPNEFAVRGIKLIYTDYKPPVYPQRFGPFIENLSVLDWLFNMGYTLPEGW
jgi:hypothetical protein